MEPGKQENYLKISVPYGYDLCVLFTDADGKGRPFRLALGSAFPVVVKLPEAEARQVWPPPPVTSVQVDSCLCVPPDGLALDPRPQPTKDSAPDTSVRQDLSPKEKSVRARTTTT